MDKRYFKVSYTWFDDLSCEAAVTYGYLVNSIKSNKLFKIDPETGEIYYRIANSFIANTLQLTDFRIRSILEELEEAGYIDIMLIKKPNQRCRYIKFNNFDDDVVLDIFFDIFDDTLNIIETLLISYIIFRINICNENFLSIDNMLESIGSDWNDAQLSRCEHFLKSCNFIDEDYIYSDMAFKYADEYAFSWVKKDVC